MNIARWIPVCCLCISCSSISGDEPFIGLNPNQFVAPTASAKFLPGNDKLLTLSADKTVRVVDITTSNILDSYRFQAGPGRKGELTCFDLSSDGSMFAVGTYGEPSVWEATVFVVSLTERKIVHVLKGHRRSVANLRFHPEGHQLVSSGQDSQIIFWNLANGTKDKSLFLSHPDKPSSERQVGRILRYNDSGSQIACATNFGSIYSFDTNSFNKSWSIKQHKKLITGMVWFGDKVVSCGLDGQMNVSDARSSGRKTSASRRFGEDNNFLSLARKPGSQQVYWSNGATDSIEEWLNPNGTFKRDGSTHQLGYFDVNTGESKILKRDQRYAALSFAGDGSKLVSCNHNRGTLNIFDAGNLAISNSIQSIVRPKFQPRLIGPERSTIAWGEQFHHLTKMISQPETFDTVRLERKQRSNSVLPKQMYDRLDGKLFALQQNSNYKWGIWNLNDQRMLKQGELDRARMGDRIKDYAMLGRNKVFISTDRRQFVLNPYQNGNRVELTGQIGGSASDVQRNLKKGVFLTNTAAICFSIWDINTKGDPLVNYVITDHDYVAWTPDGYYACSAGGERLVGWHVNNGEKEFASFFPLEKFSEKYFNEALIRSIAQDKLAVNRAKSPGPITSEIPASIEITEPRETVVDTDTNEILVKVRANSKTGRGNVSEVSLLINNRVRTEYFLTPPPGKSEFEFKVRLEPGEQAIRARVFSSNTGNTSESNQTVRVTYTPPNAQRKPIRKLYYLGIGIDEYDHFDDLRYCVSDVESIGSIVGAKSGSLFMEPSSIKVIPNIKSKDEFFEAIDEIKETFGATDLLVVYWSGHGANDDNKDFHFVLPPCEDPEVVGNDTTLRRKGISADKLAEELTRLEGHIVVLLGTCFSGKAVNRIQQAVERLGRDSSKTGKGLMMISSAGASQEAFEDSELKSSKFAFQLQKALKGQPTRGVSQMPYYCETLGGDCIVFTDSMKDYLIESMKHITNGLQQPVPSGFDFRSFKLTKVRQPAGAGSGGQK